jgi:malate/lactate dehydrogenase
LGRKGIEKILEYKLDDKEKAALAKSSDSVRQTLDALRSLVKA